MLSLVLVFTSIFVSTLLKNLIDTIVKHFKGAERKDFRLKLKIMLGLPGLVCSMIVKMVFQILMFLI